MRKIELGKTGLMVSEVAFGGIPIQRLGEDQAVKVIQKCMDLGVNFLDTAHGYGTSEECIGRAIAGRRDKLILATKSPARDARTFREQMELSFQRLGVRHIHLFQFHGVSSQKDYERVISPGGPLEVAREAKSSGRIGHIGITSHKLDIAMEAVKSGLFETLMFPFNYIGNEPAEELIPLCREHGVGFIAMKPMGGGLLDDAKVSFNYLRQFPGIIPVVGIEKGEEMAEIVSIMESTASLTRADLMAIEQKREELGKRFCRACDYCQPCSQEIPISSVLRIRSFAKRFPEERFYSEWGQNMIEKAETCIDCGECEPRCPYELPIREMLRENVTWYREQLDARQSE